MWLRSDVPCANDVNIVDMLINLWRSTVNSFISLSGVAVASKSAICCSMPPTFSGDMLFCVTSARNAEIRAVKDVVSIISFAV